MIGEMSCVTKRSPHLLLRELVRFPDDFHGIAGGNRPDQNYKPLKKPWHPHHTAVK